ncbi:hypothetical protein ACVSLK_24495 [Pseudomonas aeruginosa]|uniref:hypothetical protein n=1 Tax=Pseudomonas aeruginosa TaxID=287 RepID=UPI0024BD61FA|nr:hypothetical protein [Pseudomonas aeruginosa]MDJ1360142.1 hypothetical protein [Pseudomonas aeruginosa]
MPVENWMQFGTFAEQEEFIYPSRDAYAGVMINGNMVAHTPSAMAGFLLERIPASTKFIIDPFTHAFQHSPAFITGKKGEIKTSISKLAERYDSPIVENLGSRPLAPKDFTEKNIRKYTEKALEFQRCFLHDYMINSEVAKYFDEDEVKREPYALVAPYFYLTDINHECWTEISIKLLRIARNYTSEKEKKLFCNLVINKGLMQSEDVIAEIISKLKNEKPDGFIVWIDDLDEASCSVSELHSLIKIFKLIRSNKDIELINLHGGYFSILSGAEDFGSLATGVCHGPEYGESRAVVPVGGGIPTSKYYIPDLHSREKYRDCLMWFNKAGWLENYENFHHSVCNCRQCVKVIDGNIENFTKFGGEGTTKTIQRGRSVVNLQFPTRDEKTNCLRHYLNVKSKEYEKANTLSGGELISDLSSSIQKYIEITGPEYISHLFRWRQILESESGTTD